MGKKFETFGDWKVGEATLLQNRQNTASDLSEQLESAVTKCVNLKQPNINDYFLHHYILVLLVYINAIIEAALQIVFLMILCFNILEHFIHNLFGS